MLSLQPGWKHKGSRNEGEQVAAGFMEVIATFLRRSSVLLPNPFLDLCVSNLFLREDDGLTRVSLAKGGRFTSFIV